MQPLTVIKIGGNIINDATKLEDFLKQFAALDGLKILVHGGGKVASKIGAKMGVEPKYILGRRVTDAQTLDLVTMVYGGLINKNIVAQLLRYNQKAIGLTGADSMIIKGEKRNPEPIDYGFVADLHDDSINLEAFQSLLQNQFLPVIAPLAFCPKCSSLLNVNADTVAQAIAQKLISKYCVQLVYCFELPGVLKDVNNKNSVIPIITDQLLDNLKEQNIISEGMIPKLENALIATKAGVEKVIIGASDNLKDLCHGLTGTTIK